MDQEDLANRNDSWRQFFGRGTDYAGKATSVIPVRYRAAGGVCLRVLIGVAVVYIICTVHCWHARPEPKECDREWAHFQGQCYKLIRSKTFREAVRSCRFEHGAELASIHSATVNEYLSNFASVTDEYNEDHEHYGAWIGLHRLAGNSTRWRWVDGTPADYLPFDEDTVKASTRKRSQRLCVAILNSQWTEHKLWSAAQCDTANQTAICQKLP